MLHFNLDTQKPTTDLTPMDPLVEVAGKFCFFPFFSLIQKNCARKKLLPVLEKKKKKKIIIDSALRDSHASLPFSAFFDREKRILK